VWDTLNLVLGCGGDSHVYQQRLEPTDADWSLDPVGLPLICITVQLLVLRVPQGRVLLIVTIFIFLDLLLLGLLSRGIPSF
jgi:hypothetical protein